MTRVAQRHLTVARDDDGQYDPWGGVDSKDEYDADAFYVDSTNKHDHTAQTRVPMRPDIYAEITRLIASGELGGTPIRSYQAFMRDAAYHNLYRVSRIIKSGSLEEFADMQRRLAQIDGLAQQAETLRKIVSEADERINVACKAGDKLHVEQMLEMYEPMCDKIREPYATELGDTLHDARRWLKASK